MDIHIHAASSFIRSYSTTFIFIFLFILTFSEVAREKIQVVEVVRRILSSLSPKNFKLGKN